MTQHAQHIQDDPVAEVSASSSTADLEDRIRDAVRPVLQEWASGELARLIERVLKEEVAQLTSNTLEQPSKSVARING